MGVEDESPLGRRSLRGDWERVCSARRFYVTLNEHLGGAGQLIEELTLFLIEEAAGRGLDVDAVRACAAHDLDYERFMAVSELLGEREACDLVRAVFPVPPTSVPRLSGSLVGRAKTIEHRQPNARLLGIRED